MHAESELLRLVALVYDAAQTPSLWPAFLEAYAGALGAPMAAFQRHRFDRHASEIGEIFGISPPLRSSYNAEYARVNIFRDSGQHLYTTGNVLFDEDICSRATLQRSTFYNEFLLPMGGVYSASGVIDRVHEEAVVITALRGPSQHQWDDSDLKTIQLLLPHVTRGYAMDRRLRLLASGTDVLDSLDVGVMFVRTSGEVVYANRTAEAILETGDGLILCDGILHACDMSTGAALRQALRDATAAVPSLTCSIALPVPRATLLQPYQVITTPITQSLPAFIGMPSPHAMLVIVDPEHRRAMSPEVLGSLYGLTPREAELASRLSTGATVQAAATELGMTYETARSHLRRVFEKTGTSRQAELIALLARLPAAN